MWKVTIKSKLDNKTMVTAYNVYKSDEAKQDIVKYLQVITSEAIEFQSIIDDLFDTVESVFKHIKAKLTDHGRLEQLDSIKLQTAPEIIITLQ